jgi:hypothetical protein
MGQVRWSNAYVQLPPTLVPGAWVLKPGSIGGFYEQLKYSFLTLTYVALEEP